MELLNLMAELNEANLASEISSLFVEPLYPVAPNALKKASKLILEGLDLDAQINEPPESDSEEEIDPKDSWAGFGVEEKPVAPVVNEESIQKVNYLYYLFFFQLN